MPVKIDNFDVDLKGTAGKYLSLVVCHDQNPEVLKEIRKKLNKLGIKVELKGQEKPVCVAETLAMGYE